MFDAKTETSKSNTPDQKLLDLIFKVFPKAEIYGIYVVHHILGETGLCSEIDVIIKDESVTSLMPVLTYYFRSKGYLTDNRTRAFSRKFEHQFKLKIDNRDYLLIFSINEPFYKAHFSVACLRMNQDKEIRLLLRPSQKKQKRFLDDIYQDIMNRELKMVGSLDNIDTLYELRVTYSKLIRDAISLINQGWELKSDLKFKVYSEIDDHNCAICHESVLQGNSLQLRCDHIYHLDCIHENLMVIGPTGRRCPVCREEIISYDYIKQEIIW